MIIIKKYPNKCKQFYKELYQEKSIPLQIEQSAELTLEFFNERIKYLENKLTSKPDDTLLTKTLQLNIKLRDNLLFEKAINH